MAEQLCLFANIERAEEFVRTVNELKELAEETRSYLRILCAPLYDKALSKVLPSQEERAVYVASREGSSSRDVAKATGVGYKKVQKWRRVWKELGIGKSIPAKGKSEGFKARYSLLELAVAVLEGEVGVD